MPAATPASLGRILQLASPALPVGGYSYSQGLEAAVQAGFVHDAASAQSWIEEMLTHAIARFEAPVFVRLHQAAQSNDAAGFAAWNRTFLASRETRELRGETRQMGFSLVRWARDLGIDAPLAIGDAQAMGYPAAFAAICVALTVDVRAALTAYVWSWLENQVMAAIKCVPLGQTDGQRILFVLGAALHETLELAATTSDDAMINVAPMLAVLCSRHETQYSRLFRS